MSIYQKEYLLRLKRYRRYIVIWQFVIISSFILFWELAARFGIINDFIFSSPLRMIKAAMKMQLDGSLTYHTLVTLTETFISFIAVTLIGIIVAILMWSRQSFSDIIEPYVVTLNSLPKSALAPVIIVWLGTGLKSIIITASSVAVFGTILTIYTSFYETDPEKIKLITTLHGNRFHILTKLILPGSLQVIINNMKVNIGLCLVGVIIAEFLVANAGLGYVIIYNSQIFKMDLVLASICILCVMAALIYKGINLITKLFKI